MSAADPPPVFHPGQLNVGFVGDLRGPQCGALSAPSCLLLSAALWALFRSNQAKSPRQLNVGLYAYDTCGDVSRARRQLFRLVENVGHVQTTLCLEQRIPPVFGVVAWGQQDVLTAASQTLGAFDIPLLAERPAQGAFSPRASPRALAKAISSFLVQLGWWTATLDSRSDAALAGLFVSESTSLGISLDSHPDAKVHILFLNRTSVHTFLNILKEDTDVPVIVASLDIPAPNIQIKTPSKVLVASPLVHSPDPGFLDFLQRSQDNTSNTGLPQIVDSICPGLRDNETLSRILADPSLRYDIESMVKSIGILVEALRSIESRACKSGVNCLPILKASLQKDILEVLNRQSGNVSGDSFSSLDPSLNFRFDEEGHSTTARIGFTLSTASQMSSQRVLKKIGWFNEDSGLLLDLDKLSQSGFWVKGQSVPGNPSHWRAKSGRSFEPSTTEGPRQESNETLVTVTQTSVDLLAWMSKPWVLSILILVVFGLLVVFYISVFLMVKMCEQALKRTNNFLNFALLFSLLVLQFGASLFLFKNTPLLCLLQRFFHNLAYIFTFACLLLRGMDLHAKKHLGLGGRSSRLNQLLTLLFMISVQVALEVQWAFLMRGSSDKCTLFEFDFIFSQIYLVVILFVSTILSYWTRYVPYCHKDGQNLFITTSLSTLVFVTRIAVYSVLDGTEPKEICSSIGMILTTFIVVGCIYFPQLYNIHKMGNISHKPLSYTDSFSSVFTLFKEIDSISGESSSSLKRSRKPPKTLESSYCKSMVELKRDTRTFDRTSSFKQL